MTVALPLAATLPRQARATGSGLTAIYARWLEANDRLGAINWVGDNIAIERLGRAPTAAEEAEFKAAHDAEDEAYSAVLSYQPRTLAELHAKAKIFGSEGSVGEPFYIDADTALGFIATDIARLGEAG